MMQANNIGQNYELPPPISNNNEGYLGEICNVLGWAGGGEISERY